MSECLPLCRAAELDEPGCTHAWLVESLWSRNGVGVIAAHPKLGKTWLGLDLALSVATATPCLDTFAVDEPGHVLAYLAEDHTAAVRQRLAGLCVHRGLELADVPIDVITAPSLRLDLESDRRRLAATISSIGPVLLLLDPLVRLHHRDENHSGDIAEMLAFLRQLQRTYELAIIVVHHMRKNGASHPGQALRGSGDLHAWTDSALYLRRHHGHLLLQAEHRAAPAPEPVELDLVTQPDGSATHLAVLRHGALDPEPVMAAPAIADRLLDLLRDAQRPLTRFDLRRALRINNQRLGDELAKLEDIGQIERRKNGWVLNAATPDQHP